MTARSTPDPFPDGRDPAPRGGTTGAAGMRAAPCVLLMGPTATGKSEIAQELARRVGGEIVSVDSCAIYRGLDIGTAKPSPAVRAQIPHHLVDIREPHEQYSVGDFFRDATGKVAEARGRGNVPVMVGGTIMYFNALIRGLSELPQTSGPVREEVAREMEEKGPPRMHAWLADRDPETAARLHPNDRQRVARAIEVLRETGKPLAEWLRTSETRRLPGELVTVSLMPADIPGLRGRIRDRLGEFVRQGWVDEISGLLGRGDVMPDSPAMRSVGYRQMVPHALGKESLATALENANVATRRLAKRQRVWLRSLRSVAVEIDPGSVCPVPDIERLVGEARFS